MTTPRNATPASTCGSRSSDTGRSWTGATGNIHKEVTAVADTLRNTNTLNDVPSGERVHIGFFGIRNAGKSSVVNAVTNQELALVSEVRGTTTDPVLKAMELLPIGPVVIIDTPGIDDEGELGAMRVERTRQALRQTDVAVLVADSTVGLQEADRELLDLFAEKKTPCVVAFNKTDLLPGGPASYPTDRLPKGTTVLPVSAKTGDGIDALKELLGKLSGTKQEKYILKDLVEPGDTVV
ncbi:MAG: 50S ribosome-binding GTPase, partial [Clostridia bacterium]|nr:50S ribosome-binding GTPase [Clostridia bacterium]